MTGATIAEPREYLQAQMRWRWGEIAFWLATLLPFVITPDYLLLASQIAIAGLFVLSLDLILGFAGIVRSAMPPISASAPTRRVSCRNGVGANR